MRYYVRIWTLLCTLKAHMLEEMRNSVYLFTFIITPRADKNKHCHSWIVLHWHGHNPQAVFKCFLLWFSHKPNTTTTAITLQKNILCESILYIIRNFGNFYSFLGACI